MNIASDVKVLEQSKELAAPEVSMGVAVAKKMPPLRASGTKSVAAKVTATKTAVSNAPAKVAAQAKAGSPAKKMDTAKTATKTPAKVAVKTSVKAPLKAVAKAATPAPAKAATKIAPTARAKVAAKTPAKAAVVAKLTTPSKAPAPLKAAKPATAKAIPATSAKDKAKKEKLVRDSFTMPEPEYAVLGQVKKACLAAGVEVKKSQLLRVGLLLLSHTDVKSLAKLISNLAPLKAGRPKKEK
jgi:hypothetical protein